MPIYADLRQFPTLTAYEQYLRGLTPFAGADRCVVHHAWSPDLPQWRGMVSMRAILNYYINTLGWDRFPHLFVTPTALYVMTPPNQWGIHANGANRFGIGFETVWNADKRPFDQPTLTMLFGAMDLTDRWLERHGRAVQAPIGHREAPQATPGKTCPGRWTQMDALRQQYRAYCVQRQREREALRLLTVTDVMPFTPPKRFQIHVPAGANVRQSYATDAPIALQLPQDTTFLAGELRPGGVWQGSNAWLHIVEVNLNGRTFHEPGFVHAALASEVV